MENKVVKSEIHNTAAKLGGGAATYVGSYTVVDKTLTVAEASDIAALVAASLTALYFAAQFLYTVWKWRQEVKALKAKLHVCTKD